jgi:hypothetical protein
MIIRPNQNVEHQGTIHHAQQVNINQGHNSTARCKLGTEWHKVYKLPGNNWTTDEEVLTQQCTAEVASELPERLFRK